MDSKNCAVCQSPMRWQPAGVSKRTGKPYNGFFSCPNRCQQPRTGYQPTPPQPAPEPRNYDRENFGKVKYGFMLEAYKKGMDIETAEMECEEWTERVMRKLGEPEVKNYGDGEQATEVPF